MHRLTEILLDKIVSEMVTEGVVKFHATMNHPTDFHAHHELKKLAQAHKSNIRVGLSPDGPWLDAKRNSELLNLDVRRGREMHFETEGEDAEEAAAHLKDFIDNY